MTIQEIKEFVQGELSYLNLSTKEQERIIARIKNKDRYYKSNRMEDVEPTAVFLNKLEDCLEFFKIQGFDEETAIEYAKKVVISHNNKDFKLKLAFLRVTNIEETAIMNDSLCLRFNLENAHVKKMHLVVTNNQQSQSKTIILHTTDTAFEKRFDVQMKELLKKYHLTQETMDV